MEDTNKDNLPPSEVSDEQMVTVDSILSLLRDTMRRFQISLIIPFILENSLTFRQHVQETPFELLADKVDAFIRDKTKKNMSQEEAHLNFDVLELVELFHQNANIMSVLPKWINDVDSNDANALQALEIMHSMAQKHLQRSAIYEIEKEKRIHVIYHENEELKKNIKEFTRKMRNQKINLRWKLAAKDGVLYKLETDLAFRTAENQRKIQDEITQSARRVATSHADSLIRQAELEEDLEKAKASYEKTLKRNLIQEVEFRDEKNKLMAQYQLLIKKFDTNIGEKMKEDMYMQDEFDREQKKLEDFKVEFQRQEAEYHRFVTEREEEERRRQQEKLMLFIMNRAARIIQRYWRRWWRGQKNRGKGKKGKGKGKKK